MPAKSIAIIPAGGAGKRMGTAQSKQYLLLAGKPILAHTIQPFQESGAVDAIILVVPAEDKDLVGKTIVETYGFSKVKSIVPGGVQRQDSVRNGLGAVGDGYDVVLIHDGVRPFVSDDLIRRTILTAETFGAVTVGVPAKDTIKEISPEGFVRSTLSRDSLWLIQTPQAFRTEIIKSAHRKAEEDGYYGTDDAALVERMGIPVKTVAGSYDNIKITNKEDMALAEHLIDHGSRS
jgi:2-C-methyl-D-erythritol 4-phosphate cytidylyltransferase